MTLQMPQPDFLDRILRLLGKKRGVIVPVDAEKKHGPHAYARARKECFWKALLRCGDKDLSEGVMDINAYHDALREGPGHEPRDPGQDL